MRRLAVITALAAVMLMGASDDPSDHLKDPAQEARAQELFHEIRCVVCQNESIAGSEAELAHDMRMLVRERIAEGSTDQQVRDYLYQRYGDFILLRPRLTPGTAILWGAPFVILAVGAGIVLSRRRRVIPLEEDLTAAERKALEALNSEAKNPGSV